MKADGHLRRTAIFILPLFFFFFFFFCSVSHALWYGAFLKPNARDSWTFHQVVNGKRGLLITFRFDDQGTRKQGQALG